MAGASRRMTQSQNDRIYELGKAGRKTGIVLEDKGYRDKYGMEDPDIFSSPEKDNGANDYEDDDDSEENEDDGGQTMEIDNGSDAGPATIRKQLQERGSRLSIPRGRSPLKTHLQSPARQNPHLGPTSSPTRGDIMEERRAMQSPSVSRRLNFSMNSQPQMKPVPNGRGKLNGTKSLSQPVNRPSNLQSDSEDEPMPNGVDEEPEDVDDANDEPAPDFDDDDDVDLAEPAELELSEEEPEEPAEPVKQPGKRGRKPKPADPQPEDATDAEVSSKQQKKGRPGKGAPADEPAPVASKPGKRGRPARNSTSGAEDETAQESDRATKRKRVAEKKEDQPAPKAKAGRKRKSSGIGASPVVQRGPPLPKAKGLVSLRREGPDGMLLTRSGRHSFKPLSFWKGERYEDDVEEVEDIKGRRFVVKSTKGVVRYEEPDAPQTKKRRAKAGRPAGRPRVSAVKEEEDDGIEPDEWEVDSGHKHGMCLQWSPEFEHNPPDDEDVVQDLEELAVSASAIQLKDIKDATFRFAKTLTTGFFGTGIVDLPPGAEKRIKNSRRMLMSFFVHTGQVEVTVAQTTFRISKGGQFNVPRGNYYSILNDTAHPARIFFAQGCEQVIEMQSQEM